MKYLLTKKFNCLNKMNFLPTLKYRLAKYKKAEKPRFKAFLLFYSLQLLYFEFIYCIKPQNSNVYL